MLLEKFTPPSLVPEHSQFHQNDYLWKSWPLEIICINSSLSSSLFDHPKKTRPPGDKETVFPMWSMHAVDHMSPNCQTRCSTHTSPNSPSVMPCVLYLRRLSESSLHLNALELSTLLRTLLLMQPSLAALSLTGSFYIPRSLNVRNARFFI